MPRHTLVLLQAVVVRQLPLGEIDILLKHFPLSFTNHHTRVVATLVYQTAFEFLAPDCLFGYLGPDVVYGVFLVEIGPGTKLQKKELQTPWQGYVP